jgi:error-prone DNA polymerase
MATFRHVGGMDRFKEKLVGGMVRRGYEQEFALRCYSQIEGFGSYGFPESHALSFARLVYVSSWIKCHHPAVFACALLNSQPMGFYAPAQLVRDAREHEVEVRGVDVNASFWDSSLEQEDGPHALRIGFRQIDSFREAWANNLVAARAGGAFDSVEALARRASLPSRALRLLADADALGSLGLDRRAALWDARRMPGGELPLFAAANARELGEEADMALPRMAAAEHVAIDYQSTRLSVRDHPMAFLRDHLRGLGVASCVETSSAKSGTRLRTAGIVMVRQRPGKGNAIFLTIEDETGITNALIWARTFETMRRAVMASRLMVLTGEVQKSPEGVVHLMVSNVEDRSELLDTLAEGGAPALTSRADIAANPYYPRHGHPRDTRVMPKSRDFH